MIKRIDGPPRGMRTSSTWKKAPFARSAHCVGCHNRLSALSKLHGFCEHCAQPLPKPEVKPETDWFEAVCGKCGHEDFYQVRDSGFSPGVTDSTHTWDGSVVVHPSEVRMKPASHIAHRSVKGEGDLVGLVNRHVGFIPEIKPVEPYVVCSTTGEVRPRVEHKGPMAHDTSKHKSDLFTFNSKRGRKRTKKVKFQGIWRK